VFQEDGEFVLPLSTEYVTHFSAHLEDLNNDIDKAEERAVQEHKKQKKKKPKAAYSVSAIGLSECSSQLSHETNAQLEPDCELAVKQILEGHARKVAELKASGKMELRGRQGYCWKDTQ